MAKKKQQDATPSEFVTVKIGKAVHAKLKVIAASQGRDMAEIITEMMALPVDKLWKAEIAKQSEQAKGDTKS